MTSGKSAISDAASYEEIGEFWDSHDLDSYWDQTRAEEFTLISRAGTSYFAVAANLSARLRALAEQQGISPETLLNLWVQEKISPTSSPK